VQPSEVRVYVTDVAEACARGELERHRASLAPEEHERLGRMQIEGARRDFVIGRALARHALSRHAAVAPADWRFVTGPHGRPEPEARVAPAGARRLRFSLSHAGGLVACAVAEEIDVGLDVERVDEQGAGEALARRFFAPAEVRALGALPEAARARRFFQYWTLKEAYLKARGLGLSIALDGFWFVLEARAPIAIRFAAPLDDDPTRWQFDQRDLAPGHLLAVAAAVGDGAAPLAVSVERCVPEAAA